MSDIYGCKPSKSTPADNRLRENAPPDRPGKKPLDPKMPMAHDGTPAPPPAGPPPPGRPNGTRQKELGAHIAQHNATRKRTAPAPWATP